MRKTVKRSASLALALCMGAPLAACGGGSNIRAGECNIKATIAGYGVDWLEEAVAVFNETYKEEGYKVHIALTDTEINGSEMLTPKVNETDLYFTYTSGIKSLVEKSRAVLGKDGGVLLEDMTDVLESKAVGKDKKEQGGAISERIREFDIQLNRYNGLLEGYDGIYGVPWYGSSAGVYVNKRVLEEKGYTLDSFLTTDSVIEVCSALAPAEDKRLDRNEFFPVAWTGLSAGYWQYWGHTMLAQYMGVEEYDDFTNFIPESGDTQEDIIASGWTVYEDRGIYEVLKVIETLTNRDWAVPGTVSNDMIAAQVRLLEGKALFMSTGDWVYKEMERDYSEYLDDIIAVKAPVISALGVKLGLCGTTHPEPAYPQENFNENFEANYSCANCEAKLKAVIKAVDERDASQNAQIATELGVTEAQVATVRERRGYYNSDGGFSAYIPSYSNQKDIAKLFLRFMFSDDGIDIYRKATKANFVASYVNTPNVEEMTEREQYMFNRMYGADSKPIYIKTDSIIRTTNGLSWYPGGGNDRNTYLNLSYSHVSTTNPEFTAKYVYEQNVVRVKGNWKDWLKNVGWID